MTLEIQAWRERASLQSRSHPEGDLLAMEVLGALEAALRENQELQKHADVLATIVFHYAGRNGAHELMDYELFKKQQNNKDK